MKTHKISEVLVEKVVPQYGRHSYHENRCVHCGCPRSMFAPCTAYVESLEVYFHITEDSEHLDPSTLTKDVDLDLEDFYAGKRAADVVRGHILGLEADFGVSAYASAACAFEAMSHNKIRKSFVAQIPLKSV